MAPDTQGRLRRIGVWLDGIAGWLLIYACLAMLFATVSLKIDVTSSVAGPTQVYYGADFAPFSESRSHLTAITRGENKLVIPLPLQTPGVRWDPVNGIPGTFTVNSLKVSVGPVNIPIPITALKSNHDIGSMDYLADSLVVNTKNEATDASLLVDLPQAVISQWHLVTLAILAGISLLLAWIIPVIFGAPLRPVRVIAQIASGYARHVRQFPIRSLRAGWWPYVLAALTAVLLTAMSFIVGVIPVSNGAGWDGSVYLSYVQMLSQGRSIADDPYRLIRMGSFLPNIVAAEWGLTREGLIGFAVRLNTLYIALSVAFFYDFLRTCLVSHRVALVSAATLLCSWPMLVMPVYYPMLSDHVAILLSSSSLWLWARGRQSGLYVLCLWAPWIMPALFLIPWVLAAMPRTAVAISVPPHAANLLTRRHRTALFMVLGVAGAMAASIYMNQFSLSDITSHPTPVSSRDGWALPQFRTWATAAACASIAAFIWVWVWLGQCKGMFTSIRVSALAISTLLIGLSFFVMYSWIDWNSGFRGPPLVQFLALQSLSAPFKPHIAHALYFGPLVFLAISALLPRRASAQTVPWPLLCLFAGFLPLLALGSESRQWVAIFPVLVAIVALTKLLFGIRVLGLVFSILLCLPALQLAQAVPSALAQAEEFTSANWQFYFGRQGPWMSVSTYSAGIIVTAAFLAFGCLIAALTTWRSRATHFR